MTDEELADIVRSAYLDGERNLDPHDDPWLDVARAARAALCPPVAPLGPGETVTIPLPYLPPSVGRVGLAFETDEDGDARIRTQMSGGPDRVLYLDAAGVRALVLAGQRWLAIQEDDDGAE